MCRHPYAAVSIPGTHRGYHAPNFLYSRGQKAEIHRIVRRNFVPQAGPPKHITTFPGKMYIPHPHGSRSTAIHLVSRTRDLTLPKASNADQTRRRFTQKNSSLAFSGFLDGMRTLAHRGTQSCETFSLRRLTIPLGCHSISPWRSRVYWRLLQ